MRNMGLMENVLKTVAAFDVNNPISSREIGKLMNTDHNSLTPSLSKLYQEKVLDRVRAVDAETGNTVFKYWVVGKRVEPTPRRKFKRKKKAEQSTSGISLVVHGQTMTLVEAKALYKELQQLFGE